MKIITPFKVPRAWEARNAVCKGYWIELKKRANSKACKMALKVFLETSKKMQKCGWCRWCDAYHVEPCGK